MNSPQVMLHLLAQNSATVYTNQKRLLVYLTRLSNDGKTTMELGVFHKHQTVKKLSVSLNYSVFDFNSTFYLALFDILSA